MYYQDIANKAIERLKIYPNPRLEVRIFLEDVTKKSWSNLLLDNSLLEEGGFLSEEEEKLFWSYVERRLKGEPVSYITGTQDFYNISLRVNESVLIPRPETELLVDQAIIACKGKEGEIKILDLGTGSGAIAISLAVNIKNSIITAVDIDDQTLIIAKENAVINNVVDKIDFIKSNWYESLKEDQYDIIISNPPYISVDEKDLMAFETLQYEPEHALFADQNGTASYYHIAELFDRFAKEDAQLIVEIGFRQGESISKIFKDAGFSKIEILKDLSSHDRCIVCSKEKGDNIRGDYE